MSHKKKEGGLKRALTNPRKKTKPFSALGSKFAGTKRKRQPGSF